MSHRINSLRRFSFSVIVRLVAPTLLFAPLSAAQQTIVRPAGGELTYAEQQDILTLNPYSGGLVNDGPTDRFLSMIYEPLFRWNFLTSRGEPVLAVKAISQIPVTRGAKSAFLVDLKPRVRWHDSTTFRASDVVFTYNYMRDKGQNKAAKAFVNDMIASVTAKSPTQVLFEFKQAVSDPATVLNQPIIPQARFLMPSMDNVDIEHPLSTTPVGTGPYKQVGSLQQNPELVVNKAYHDSVGRIEKMRSSLQNDAPTMVASFLTVTSPLKMIIEVPDEQLKTVQASSKLVKTKSLETYKVYAIAIRETEKSPLRNARLRRALAMAINRDEMRANWFAGRGKTLPGPFTPNSNFWDETLEPLPFDADKAKAEISALGMTGKPLTLIFKTGDLGGTSRDANIARTVQEALGTAGIKVNAVSKTVSAFQSSLFGNGTADWDLAVVRMEFNPLYDISEYFHSRNMKSGGFNYMKFSNPEVDRLLDDAAGASDASHNIALMKRVSRILRDSVPAIFLVNDETIYAYKSNLSIPDGTTDSFYFFTYATQWWFNRPR